MNILIIPHVPHTVCNIPGRSNFFIENLKKNNEIHVLSWDMPYPLTFNRIRNFSSIIKNYTTSIEDNIFVHHVGRTFILPPLNRGVVNAQIRDIIDKNSIDVIFSESFIWDLVPPFDEVPVIYDLVDDHVDSYKNVPLMMRFMSKFLRIEDSIGEQIEKADHTVFVSSVLRDKYKNLSKEASVLPNGVEINKFRMAKPDRFIDKFNLDNYDYVLGYVSYFGEWSNLYETVSNLIPFLEEKNSVIIIAGVGPEVDKLRKIGSDRVILTGMVEHQHISSLMKTFDVGLLPFRKYPFTDAASPIKYFEYSAAGLKVVSSPLEEVRRIEFGNTVFFDDIKDIRNAVEMAIEIDCDKSALMRSVKLYDWSRLSNSLENILKTKL